MIEFALTDLPDQPTACRRARVPMAELPQFFDSTLPAVIQAITTQGLQPAGPPYARYHDMPTDSVDVEAGFPVTGFAATDEVGAASLPATRAVVGVHTGPYEGLSQSWQALEEWMTAQGLTRSDQGVWEIYLSDPGAEPDPATWRTQLVQPVG